MYLGNRFKTSLYLGNKFDKPLSVIGQYLTPENIDKGTQMAIQLHKSYSDIERYRNKKHE